MARFQNKVVIVSGGARGQGAAEARLLVAEGAKVVIGDVLEAEGRRLAGELGSAAVFVRHDVTDEADWVKAIEAAQAFGGLLGMEQRRHIYPAADTGNRCGAVRATYARQSVGLLPGDQGRRCADGTLRRGLDSQYLVGGGTARIAWRHRLQRDQVGAARHDQSGGHRLRAARNPRELGPPWPDRYRDSDRSQCGRQPASRAAGADEAHALRRERLYHWCGSCDRRRCVAVNNRSTTTEAPFGLPAREPW
jgi:short chain dehydrogenase